MRMCADAEKPPAFSLVLAHRCFCFGRQVLPLVCVGYCRGSRVPPLLHASCISFADAMKPHAFSPVLAHRDGESFPAIRLFPTNPNVPLCWEQSLLASYFG